MGLKIGEAFKDRCFLTVVATGLPATLLADVTCTVIDESGNRATLVVTEESNGWYTAPFTPDAAGTWATEWSKTANPELYMFHYPYKEFHAGAGQEADIYTRLGAPAGTDVSADIAAIKAETASLVTKVDTVDDYVDTEIGDIHTDVGTCITASGVAAAYAIVNSGLVFRGIVTAAVAGVSFTIGTLAGLGAGIFADATSPWYAYVLRSNGGVSGAPQGEYRQVLTYVTATGLFTTNAFSVAVAVNDDVIITSNILPIIRDIHDTDLPLVKTDTAAILVDTNELQTDLHDGGRLDLLIDSILGDSGELQTDWVNGGRLDLLIDAIKARTDHHEITKAFFSATDDIITCNTDSSDLTLPSVVLPNITGTITHVYAGIKFRMIENTNAATNGLNGAQDIQVKESAAGAYVDAINLVDNQWLLAATTREGGDAAIGNIDIVAQVAAFNKTYDFIIDNNDVDQANLNLCDVQTFLIVSYY